MSYVLLKKEIIELKREKKLLFLTLIFLVISFFSVGITKFTPKLLEMMFPYIDLPSQKSMLQEQLNKPTNNQFISMYLKNMLQMGVIIITLSFNDNVAKELSEKSIYNLLSLGISRKKFLFGKLISMSILTVVILFISNIVFWILISNENIDFNFKEFITLFSVITIKHLIVITFLLLMSVIFKNGWSAALSSLILYGIFHLSVFIPKLNQIIPFYYWKKYELITVERLLIGIALTLFWMILINIISVFTFKGQDI